MKNFLLLTALFAIILTSCRQQANEPPSQQNAITEFTEQFNRFYETYAAADISFVDSFTEDVISIDTNGDVMKGRDDYHTAMVQMFDTYEIDLLSYTQPEIVYSRYQIVTYNDYEELFISKSSGDTTRVEGTWIGVWQPEGDKWLVKMNTFHLKE